jgi:hypothetical protein
VVQRINFDFGPGTKCRGAIYDTMDSAYLRDDLLEVDLPNGLTIDVSWIPHHDPRGTFRIRVFREYVTEVIETLIVHNIQTLKRALPLIAEQFSQTKQSDKRED